MIQRGISEFSYKNGIYNIVVAVFTCEVIECVRYRDRGYRFDSSPDVCYYYLLSIVSFYLDNKNRSLPG